MIGREDDVIHHLSKRDAGGFSSMMHAENLEMNLTVKRHAVITYVVCLIPRPFLCCPNIIKSTCYNV